MLVNTSIQSLEEDVMSCNIGTDSDPKFVRLSKSLFDEKRKRYVDILKEFSYVFAWIGEDIKTYDIDIIQHTITFKPNKNPFRKQI